MDLKAIILGILALGGLIPLVIFVFNIMAFQTGQTNATALMERTRDVVIELVVPWWVPLLIGGGVLGALLLIGLFFWLGKDAL